MSESKEVIVIRKVNKKESSKGDAYLIVTTDSGSYLVWDEKIFKEFVVNAQVEATLNVNGKYKNITAAKFIAIVEAKEEPKKEVKKPFTPWKKSGGSTYPTQEEKLQLERVKSDGQARGNYRTIIANLIMADRKITLDEIKHINMLLKGAEQDYFGSVQDTTPLKTQSDSNTPVSKSEVKSEGNESTWSA